MIICDRCGKENPDLQNVCSNCGHELWGKAPITKRSRRAGPAVLVVFVIIAVAVALVVASTFNSEAGSGPNTNYTPINNDPGPIDQDTNETVENSTGTVTVVIYNKESQIISYEGRFGDLLFAEGFLASGETVFWSNVVQFQGDYAFVEASATGTWAEGSLTCTQTGYLVPGGSVVLFLEL